MALVERRLPVRARRVGDVGEALSTREDRRLPSVPPQARRAPHPLAAYPVGAALDRERLVADLQRPRRPAELFESPRVAHEVALLLVLEDPARVWQQGAIHPWRHRAADVDLGPDGHEVALAREMAGDLRLGVGRVGLTVDAELPQAEGLDQLEGQRPGTEDARLAVGAGGMV